MRQAALPAERRTRFTSAVIAPLFLVPMLLASLRVEASLTRTAPATTDAQPAPSCSTNALERALGLEELPAPESVFSLFAGDELEGVANERLATFHPLAAVSLLVDDRAPPELGPRYPKTRVWAIGVLGSTLVSRSSGLSLETQWACGDFSCGLASGGRKDPLGLQEFARPAGAPPIRLAPPPMPEPIPRVPGQPLDPWARYDISPRYLVPGVAPESLDAFRAALLEAEERNRARPVGVGSRALGGRTADELTAKEQEEFLENRRRMRTDPVFRAQVQGVREAVSHLRTPGAGGVGGGGDDGDPPGTYRDAQGKLRDAKTSRFVEDPANPRSPYEFTDAQRRAEWKRIGRDPNSGLTREERAMVEARGWRGPQRKNVRTGEWETMELSHEPVPLREGGAGVVPRWPEDHAAVDPFRQLPKDQ